MPEEPYFDARWVGGRDQGERSASLTADSLEIARVQAEETEAGDPEWIISPIAPLTFEPAPLATDDEDQVLSEAKEFLAQHFDEVPEDFDFLED